MISQFAAAFLSVDPSSANYSSSDHHSPVSRHPMDEGDDDQEVLEYTSDEGSFASPVDFALTLPALFRWTSTFERCLMHKAERVCGLPCKGTTELPVLTEDERREIVLEAQRGFREGLIDPSDCGPYYQILFSLGVPLDPLDPYLLAEEYNCWAGLAQHSLCDHDASEMYRQSKVGHNNLLAFAQLRCWTEKLTAAVAFELPQIHSIDPPPDVPVLDIEFPEWPCSAYSDEEELFTLQSFFEIMLGRNHFRGLYSLYNVPTAIDSCNVKISIDVMRTMFDDLEKKFRKSLLKGIVPKVYRSGEDISDEHAVSVAVETGLTCLANLSTHESGVLHGHLTVPFLQGLAAGAAADVRIARAVHGDHIATILIRQLELLSDESIDFPAVYCAEVTWITVLRLVTVLSRTLVPSNQRGHRAATPSSTATAADAMAFGRLFKQLYPVLLRAIAESGVPLICYTSLQTLCQCLALHQLPQDIVEYFLRKSSQWGVVSMCISGQVHLRSDERFSGLHQLLLRDSNGSAHKIESSIHFVQIFRTTAIGLVRGLCHRGQSFEDGVVVINAVGRQLLKRGVVELAIDLASSASDETMLHLLLDCLRCIARIEEGRQLLKEYSQFYDVIRGSLHHHDANIVGLALLICARLIEVTIIEAFAIYF